jgi:Family of unknown function (DUF5689)
MKKIKSQLFICLSIVMLGVFSCKKTYTLPPAKSALADAGSITIDSVIQIYGNYYALPVVAPTKLFQFGNDASITCTVMADETSGNIYKTVFVQDATGSIQVKLINSGGLYVGDLIKINLKGVKLDDYGSQIQLDSLDVEKHVTKISTGHAVIPTKMTFNEIQKLNNFGLLKYQSKLILLDSVEFSPGDKSFPFADAVNKYSFDRVLMNYKFDNSVIVRSSGYSKFAASKIPCGSGPIVAILGQYISDIQLTIRDYNEVKLSSGTCPLFLETFDNLSRWTGYNETGTINWTIGNYSGKSYANASNYVSGKNNLCKTWLISPAIDITSAPNPQLNFVSAYSYTGDALEVYVSTNYNNGNPTLATWTKLNPLLSSGSFKWRNSSKVPLSAYKSPTFRFAFVYKGTSSTGSTWEVDDAAILGE